MMRIGFQTSFRRKLLMALVTVGVVPLLICVLLMLNVFRSSLDRQTEQAANVQLSAMTTAFSTLMDDLDGITDGLCQDHTVVRALEHGAESSTEVYHALYTAASARLRDADFALYDAAGQRLYATGIHADATKALPIDWGLLRAARSSSDLVYRTVSEREWMAGYCMRAAQAIRSRGIVTGYVVVELTENHFFRLLDGRYSADSDVLVLDPHWRPIYASPALRDGTLAARLREVLLAGLDLSVASENDMYHVLKEEGSGAYLVLCQPKPVSDPIMQLLYLVTTLSILFCLILCVAVAINFSDQIFAPIQTLNHAMACVEQGDLDTRVPPTGEDEIGQLSVRFNHMTERLKKNMADLIRRQQELRDTQIRMMQAQLNPHFLYNTLDTLKWMGKINQIPEVATIASDLADILRQSISSDEFVTLGEELQLLERYTEIQKIRFSGKFSFSIRVQDDARDILIPKLILQPLVENAIIHGLKDGGAGDIVVTAVQDGETLVLSVLDNGCGISQEGRKRFLDRVAPAPGHLGLYNVDSILRLYYGRQHGLSLVDPPDGCGTCVQMRLPITRKGGTPC